MHWRRVSTRWKIIKFEQRVGSTLARKILVMSKLKNSPKEESKGAAHASHAKSNNVGDRIAAGTARTAAAEGQQRILVVDDEAQIRELLSVYLQRQGYQVATAATSEETLRTLGQTPVDMVVLDIGLKNEDGLGLLTQIKAAQHSAHVVMLTGLGFIEDLLEEAQRKGAAGYVSKVLPLDELLMAIQRVLPPSRPSADAA